MIDFSIPTPIERQRQILESVARYVMRPVARRLDENEAEHELAWDYVNTMWEATKALGGGAMSAIEPSGEVEGGQRPRIGNVMLVHVVEMLSWGDAGIYLTTPGGGLGGAAVQAVGTAEQKQRFLSRFREGEPKWAAMAMTEPHAGSDTAAIRTRAVLSEDRTEWIINGEKIFVTGGYRSAEQSRGFVVVWATIDPSAGRAGMKPFVVEAGTPGMTVTKLERKHGIRASDTAAITFADCRIPYANILGNPDLTALRSASAADAGAAEPAAGGPGDRGFKGAMATFDATRPVVAASAIGIARASVDFIKDALTERGVRIVYGAPYQAQSAVERDVMRMQAQLKAAWLLTLKAAWLMDQGRPNTLEASMCKVKAGEVVTWITQKAVEILGSQGYSTELLLEKWMRDGKINDIYEGTGQINRLIVARHILGYRSSELR
ncbi:MAG TPA: acyl-CoA dehydrogenase family protein [Ardenticatenaceae bacterium]|nr:acyl-CoA dehydrogenase family protein [Ardenticatenaceae bacterium]